MVSDYSSVIGRQSQGAKQAAAAEGGGGKKKINQRGVGRRAGGQVEKEGGGV